MKNLFFLAIGTFIIGCNFYIIAGLLPEIAKTIDESLSITGQGITVFNLAYLISAPLFAMSFRKKTEKTIVQFALTIIIIGNLTTAISENLTLFLIGRIITGIGTGIFTPSCISIAMSICNPLKKGRTLSFIFGANSAGVVFGIPFGLYVSTILNWQMTITCISFICLVALMGISLQKFKAPLYKGDSKPLNHLLLLATPKILSTLGVTCFTSMASIGLYSYIALFQVGTPNSLAMMLFFWGLGGFLGSTFVGVLVDKAGNPQSIMSLLLIGLILNFIMLPVVKPFNHIGLLPFFIWGFLGWGTTTPQQHTLFELNKVEGKFLSSLNSSAMGLGGALGAVSGGYLVAIGIQADTLPFFASVLLLAVLLFQSSLIAKLK